MPPSKGVLSFKASDIAANGETLVRAAVIDNPKCSKFDLTEYMDLDEFLLAIDQTDSSHSGDDESRGVQTERKPAEFIASILAAVKPTEHKILESNLPSVSVIEHERSASIESSHSVRSSSEEEDTSYLDSPIGTPGKHHQKRIIKRRKPRIYKYNPKPLQHKINRAFVPDALKDEEYWERRRKNNQAAQKSREERRKKELEVLTRMDRLVQENNLLIEKLKKAELRNEQLEKKLESLQKPELKSES